MAFLPDEARSGLRHARPEARYDRSYQFERYNAGRIAPTISWWGESTCRLFRQQRSTLRGQGRAIGDLDLLIAWTCVQHDLNLPTNNRRHFEIVDGLLIESV